MALIRALPWRAAATLATLALLALPLDAAFAQEDRPRRPEAPITFSCTSVKEVKVVTETVAQSTLAAAFIALPGATTTITVPTGTTGCLLLRFIAESSCTGGGAVSRWCSVRILVDGVEANPVVGTDFAFDSTDTGTETASSWESHAVERIARVSAGLHTVTVQWGVNIAGPTFRLDDWTLVVERT